MPEFRLLKGFDAYRVGDDGSFWTRNILGPKAGRNYGEWREVTLKPRPDGYVWVTLSKKGKSYHRAIHRLVLEAFVGRRKRGQVACHNNGRRADNRAVNLRWDSQRNNILDKRKHGTETPQHGECNPMAKLTADQVKELRRVYPAKMTAREAGKKYGVHPVTVRQIKRGVRWAHVL